MCIHKEFKDYNIFEKIWKIRYYITIPYYVLKTWAQQQYYVEKQKRLTFKHILRIVIRSVRHSIGKRNYK